MEPKNTKTIALITNQSKLDGLKTSSQQQV